MVWVCRTFVKVSKTSRNDCLVDEIVSLDENRIEGEKGSCRSDKLLSQKVGVRNNCYTSR